MFVESFVFAHWAARSGNVFYKVTVTIASICWMYSTISYIHRTCIAHYTTSKPSKIVILWQFHVVCCVFPNEKHMTNYSIRNTYASYESSCVDLVGVGSLIFEKFNVYILLQYILSCCTSIVVCALYSSGSTATTCECVCR